MTIGICLGLLANCFRRCRADSDDDAWLECDQLVREVPITLDATLSGSVNKFDVATLDPAALLQFLNKNLPAMSNLRVA
jgi:hypothetical protein